MRTRVLFDARVRAALLVVFVAILLASRTFVGFDRARLKLLQTPTAPQSGTVRLASSDLDPLASLHQPLAVMVHLKNSGPAGARIVVAVDGTTICEPSLAPGTERRIDCRAERWLHADGAHELTLAGAPDGWLVDYVEVATHHGNTSGLSYLVILPAGSTDYRPPAPGWIVFYCLVTIAVLRIPATLLSTRRRFVHRFVASVVVLMLFLITIAPWLSAFKVVMSIGTLTTWLAIICLPRLVTAWAWLSADRDWAADRGVVLLRAATVAAAVLSAFVILVHVQLEDVHHGNYSGFLIVSERLFDANPLLRNRDDVRSSLILLNNGGYDGQFAYFVAFDPLLRAYSTDPIQYRSVVDAVPYRYGRIGFSLLVRLFAGNNWRVYPATMIWLILGALFMSAFVLATLAQIHALPPTVGLLIAFVPGFWQSVQDGLPEPIAAATIVAGYFFLWQRRWSIGAICLAFSLLIRETGIIIVACIAGSAFLAGNRRQAMMLLAISIVPVVAWRLYVGWILFPDWGFKGFLDNPADFGWPLKGFIDLWQVIARGEYYGASAEFARSGFSYPLLLILALALAAMLVWTKPTALSVAALIYAAMAVCLNYQMIWVHVGNGQRGTFEVFIALALTLATAFRTYPRWLRVACIGFWCATGAYVFFGAFDAYAVRVTLGLPI